MKRDQAWEHLRTVTRPALTLAPSTYLDSIRANLAADGIPHAVARRDTPWLFDWLIGVSQFQGISDANAAAYTAKHGIVGWHDISQPSMQVRPVTASEATGISRAAATARPRAPAPSRSTCPRARSLNIRLGR